MACRAIDQDRAYGRLRLVCALPVRASGCFSARRSSWRVEFRSLFPVPSWLRSRWGCRHALGTSMLIWAVGIYTIIQSIEGYVIDLSFFGRPSNSPSWTLVAIVLFGSLFGVMGIALAMPLLAVGRIAVLRFYVEDWLEMTSASARMRWTSGGSGE